MSKEISFRPENGMPKYPSAHWAIYNNIIIGCYDSLKKAKQEAPGRLEWLRENARPDIKKLLND